MRATYVVALTRHGLDAFMFGSYHAMLARDLQHWIVTAASRQKAIARVQKLLS